MAGRRGARSKSSVDAALLTDLEAGVIQSRTHVEQMTLSFDALALKVLPAAYDSSDPLDEMPFLTRFRVAADRLLAAEGLGYVIRDDRSFVSDTVRGWQVTAIGRASDIEKDRRLRLMRPFVTDEHFAVREWAWLALRPHVVNDPIGSLCALRPWFRDECSFVRRFAVEVTRPRSVWGRHIALLKDEPELAESDLTVSQCDPAPYVQISVANWLNDAAKSRPDWVEDVCNEWSRCPCAHTARIIRAGRRNLPPSSA